jgi:uncharacterized protein YndB with AHSA1/START domain
MARGSSCGASTPRLPSASSPGGPTPALKAGWFSAPGAESELDFRVGGQEVNRDGTPGGAGFTYLERYCDIVPNERILYTYELYAGEALASVSVTSVAFLADGDGTLLTVTEQIQCSTGETPAPRGSGSDHAVGAAGTPVAD